LLKSKRPNLQKKILQTLCGKAAVAFESLKGLQCGDDFKIPFLHSRKYLAAFISSLCNRNEPKASQIQNYEN